MKIDPVRHVSVGNIEFILDLHNRISIWHKFHDESIILSGQELIYIYEQYMKSIET